MLSSCKHTCKGLHQHHSSVTDSGIHYYTCKVRRSPERNFRALFAALENGEMKSKKEDDGTGEAQTSGLEETAGWSVTREVSAWPKLPVDVGVHQEESTAPLMPAV